VMYRGLGDVHLLFVVILWDTCTRKYVNISFEKTMIRKTKSMGIIKREAVSSVGPQTWVIFWHISGQDHIII
jgi:hypothetical protein